MACFAQLAGERVALWIGLAFFVMGLAHGAGDEQEGQLRRIGLIPAFAYLLVGTAVAGLFIAQPIAGLAVFFSLSAWHFARSDCQLAQETRYAISGLAVGGSALLQPQGTLDVLSLAAAMPVPVHFVRALAIAGMVGCGFTLWTVFKANRGFGHAVVAFCAVLLLHPVLAVGLIFLTAHAIPIQQRQTAYYGARTVLAAVAIPTGLAIVGATGIVASVTTGALSAHFAVALALGMATPHMLTERLES